MRGRWYLDAWWKAVPAPAPSLDQLRAAPVLAVDLNAGHLAAWAVTPDGNPAGPPLTIPAGLAGLPAAQRDGRLRAAISSLTRLARQRDPQRRGNAADPGMHAAGVGDRSQVMAVRLLVCPHHGHLRSLGHHPGR